VTARRRATAHEHPREVYLKKKSVVIGTVPP
jgi:hypothetical protein